MKIIQTIHNHPTIWAHVKAFGIRVREWRERVRQRRELAFISARDLRDAGLSLENVHFEINHPFWQPLSRERK
jgi:uncharacterized protein YjiS (DUF1127 family)